MGMHAQKFFNAGASRGRGNFSEKCGGQTEPTMILENADTQLRTAGRSAEMGKGQYLTSVRRETEYECVWCMHTGHVGDQSCVAHRISETGLAIHGREGAQMGNNPVGMSWAQGVHPWVQSQVSAPPV